MTDSLRLDQGMRSKRAASESGQGAAVPWTTGFRRILVTSWGMQSVSRQALDNRGGQPKRNLARLHTVDLTGIPYRNHTY